MLFRSYTAESPANGPYKITATAPDNTRTERYLYKETSRPGFRLDNVLTGKTYDERSYDAAGNLRRRALTQWEGTIVGNGYPIRDPHVTRATEIMMEPTGDALAHSMTFAHDQYLNVVRAIDYDNVPMSRSAAASETLIADNNTQGYTLSLHDALPILVSLYKYRSVRVLSGAVAVIL